MRDPKASAGREPGVRDVHVGVDGRPKGVAVTHRGVVRLVRGGGYVRLDGEETLLQVSPLSFDASTFEIWGALLNGCRLVMYPKRRPTPREVGEVVREKHVTTLLLVTGLLHEAAEGELWGLEGVRQLLTGGDVLSPKQAERVLRGLPGCALVNGYGPTESTTFACCQAMQGAEGAALYPSVPIGGPIGNTQAYVLDEEMELVGVGTLGELYLGGDGLARGYQGRPGLTAERFVANPSRTAGDAAVPDGRPARWRGDGTLEFVGRRPGRAGEGARIPDRARGGGGGAAAASGGAGRSGGGGGRRDGGEAAGGVRGASDGGGG